MISSLSHHPVARGSRAVATSLLVLSLCGVLAACERAPAPAHETPAQASTPATEAPVAEPAAAPAPAPAPADVPNTPPSTARGVLDTFASAAPTWEAFAAQPDVTWFDREPVADGDSRSRAGRIAWVDTDPPPAPLPPETEAGLTLIGHDAVEQVMFRKARPSNDYETAIRAQLGGDVQVTRIADQCAHAFGSQRADKLDTAFFEVRIGSDAPLYMEGRANRDGGNTGPGDTTFGFTRTRPDARIQGMGCNAS